MPDYEEISVAAREDVGKGAARRTRRAGRVPAIVYGDNKDPVAVSVELRALEREIAGGSFFAKLYDLKLGERSQRVLPRDVQFDVVSDRPLHVDFLRLAADAKINISVPVVFANEEECPGLRQGGVLNVVRYEIEVFCRADSIPEQFVCDLTGLEIGDSLHISDIDLPDGVEPTISDRDFTVLTVAAPTIHVEPVEEDEELEEGLEGEALEGEALEGEAEASEEAAED